MVVGVGPAVIDAHRNLSVVGGIMLFLIFIGSSLPSLGLSLTMTGMMVLLLIFCFGPLGALPKRRRLVLAVRDRAMLAGPPAIWNCEWISVPCFWY